MAATATVLFGMTACGGNSDKENMADTMAPDTMVEEIVDTLDAMPAADTALTDTAILIEETAAPEKEKAAKGDGYTTTASGLKYKEIKKGTGKSPKATDVVMVNYEGRLLDGTVFDSSYQRGEPATFPLNRVIPGWTEGLQLMKEGATYEFLIPSALAYGERGAGSAIPPNSDLIFLVELIKVQ